MQNESQSETEGDEDELVDVPGNNLVVPWKARTELMLSSCAAPDMSVVQNRGYIMGAFNFNGICLSSINNSCLSSSTYSMTRSVSKMSSPARWRCFGKWRSKQVRQRQGNNSRHPLLSTKSSHNPQLPLHESA